MKKILLLTICIIIGKVAFSQDTFTYKTLKASSVKESTVQLEGMPQASSSFTSKSINLSATSKGGGTVNGSTMGNLSVSSTGGVSYSVPIDVPPGLNGVQPDISLYYDSQSGNGLAGWGWNVSGVSVITRIASTQFHDDQIDAVDFDAEDRFALDGQRLILKTGTYGGDGAEYQTENYSNIKITSHLTHPTSGVSGPRYFKVYYPDGSIAYYGHTDNSRSRMDYAITYWENPQGVRIDYIYSGTLGTLKIRKINYGSKNQSSHINEIEFLYGGGFSNDRWEQSYIGGEEFEKRSILQKIEVRGASNTPYRAYDLSFDKTTLGYARLTSIQEKTGDLSLSRAPINFSYGNTTSSINSVNRAGLSVQNIEKRNAKVVSLDISGDGKMDFLVYPTTGADAKKKFWLFDDIQNSSNLNFGTEVNTGSFQEIFPISWLSHNSKILSGQGLTVIQNDGTDKVKFKVYSGGSTYPILYQYEKLWDAPTYKPQDYQVSGNPSLYRVPLRYISGDFDGDGLSDVIALERKYTTTECIEYPSTNDPTCQDKVIRDGIEYCCYGCSTSTYSTTKAHFIRLDRRVTSNFASVAGFFGRELKTTDKLHTVDVNGDGKTDILQFRDGEVFVYSLNNNNSLQLLWSTPDTKIDLAFPPLLGDYNGDGKIDFMMPTGDNSYDFSFFLSTGTGFTRTDKTLVFRYRESSTGGGNLYGRELIPVDIDGDSKTDIIEYNTTTDNDPTGQQYLTVYHNKPTNFDAPQFEYGGYHSTSGPLSYYPIPIFLTSDRPNGNLDFASISDNNVTSFEFTKDHREDMTLKQITNNGITTDIKYDQVNPYYGGDGDPSYFSAYTQSYTQTYPFININVAPSFKVVRELEQTGDGLSRKQQFYYEGGVSHIGGLGFIGFEIMKQSNWHGTNVPALWTISKYNPLLRGAITEQIVANTYSSNPSSYMSKVNYFYDYKLIANPGSPAAPQFPLTLSRSAIIAGQQTDQAEQSITLEDGFHAIGSNGDYWADIIPPNEQPGDTGYSGVVDLRLERIEKDDGLTGVFSTESYTYDEYNNPLVTTNTFPNGSRVLNYYYSNNQSASNNTYHIGKPTKMVERLTLNGNSFTTEEQYTYNNNLVTKVKRKGNGTGWITQDIEYNTANGNITKKILTADGETPRVQQYYYDVLYDNRFLTKSTDIEGLETTYEYYSDTGSLKKVTDPYGLETSYEYDKWNRVKKETDYLSNITDHTYTILSGGSLRHNVDYATGAKEQTTYNAFGWVTRTGTLSLNSQWVYTDFEYYLDGKPKRESEPHHSSPSQWNTTLYDTYGRPSSQTLHTGRNISYTYSGLSSTVNDGVKSTIATLDALGNTVKVQDPGGTVDYTYHASGQLKSADYGGHVVTISVDGWGRKTSLNDSSAGTYSYSYNGYGQILEQTGPKGTTTYIYDDFGKVTTETMTGDLTDHSLSYVYDNTTKLLKTINGLDNTNSARAYTYQYTYDTYQRPKKVTEDTGLASFEYDITYDPQYGRVEKEKLVSTLSGGATKTITTRNVYDTSGILTEIWNDGTPDKLWELGSINARGQALTVNLGNGMIKTKVYDAYGYLTKIEDKESGSNPTVALHTEYDFNEQRGTLNSRENFGFNWQENFGYDNLDRLTTITGDVAHTMAYNSNGTIDSNTSLGDYAYADSGKKYRLTRIDPNATGETYFQQHSTQQISYNAFKKPVDIHQQGHGRVSFEYGPMMARSTAYYGGEQSDRTQRRYKKHYSSIIPAEIVQDTQAGTTKIITYVAGDGYSAPIAHIKTTGTGAIDEYHYLHRDYLGSILAITDADGDVKEERQFGAWGVVDKFSDSGGGTTFGHGSLLGRGYTGHEHFFEVGLIHMNGRMYDAKLGRFLSPDNFIQAPFNTQSYNRYGYVLNNPLMYTDPGGEFFVEAGLLITFAKIIVGAFAAVGAYALITNYTADSGGGSGNQTAAPAPSNNSNNSRTSSSASPPSRSRPGRSLDWATYGEPLQHMTPVIGPDGNVSWTESKPFGISQTGNRDPLQGITPPPGFVPNDGLDEGFNITAEDVVDTLLDFVPFVGGIKDIYKGIRDGDGWQVAIGAGSLVLDVLTLGSASIIKGTVKTGIKAGGRALAKKAAKKNVKKVPNPFGRRGSPAHVERVLEAEKRLTSKGTGWRTISGGSLPEARSLSGRYADLVIQKKDKIIAVQVGRATKKSRIPIARERRAIKDLRDSGEFDHVFFLEYK